MTKMRGVFMVLSASSRQIRRSGIERSRQPLLLVKVTRTLPELRSTDAGRTMVSHQVAVGVLADDVIHEQILRDDHVAFYAHHLGDVGNAPRAVAQARCLNDDVDR